MCIDAIRVLLVVLDFSNVLFCAAAALLSLVFFIPRLAEAMGIAQHHDSGLFIFNATNVLVLIM